MRASNFIYSLVLLLTCGSAVAQRALTEIPNADPAYQLSLLKPAEGFEINLFASDPMIAKPTAIAFDRKGRLFVACTPIYPHIKPGDLPSDQIIRLEDTDGDGVADKHTVFADGLLIPTAVLPNPDGVYVANSTELLFFVDKNDDGVADSRKVIYSGFGTEDTHHIIHTLRQGPGGRIYFNQSIYTHSHVETPYGYRDLQAGGVWQFRPETLELGVYMRGLVNTWGLQFDRWGQTFQTDGAGSEGINYSFPNSVFRANVGYEKFLDGLNPGQPKMSGLEIINGHHFPEAWQGRLVTNDFRGNRINTFEVSDSNSGYISRKKEDLVTSVHGAFRPIDVQNGPDGALYVADWYNPIIQHGEVDFRDERRDHTHGRIWRVTAKNRPLQKAPDFASSSVTRLLEQLKSVDAFVRDHAKRELKFRGKEAVFSELTNWIRRLNHGHPNYEEFLLEALWVSQTLDELNPQVLEALLNSDNFKVRAAALRVLEERPANYPTIMSRLEKAVTDESPRVRNEAIQVLLKLGTVEAAKLVVKVLDLPMDENLEFSTRNAMRQLQSVWLPHARNKPDFFGENLSHLFCAIRSVEVEEAIQPLERLWQSGRVGDDYKAEAMVLLAERGNASILKEVVQEVAEFADTDPEGTARALAALGTAAKQRGVKPDADLSFLLPLISHPNSPVQVAAIQLAGNWKLEPSISTLKMIISNPDTRGFIRNIVVASLVEIGSGNAKVALSELAESELPIATKIDVAAGYASADPRQATDLVVKLLEGLEAKDDGTALVVPYIAKRQLPALLAKALGTSTLNAEATTRLMRRVSTASIDTTTLQSALQKAAGIESVNMNLSPDQMAAMVDFVESQGDAVRGEEVYRRENLLCMTCHAIGGAGGTLGPDFTSIGASAPVDYLIDSLLQPQKQIKEGYHVVMVTRKDGTVAAGRLATENDTSITLQDPADQLIEIPKADIASQEMSPISLMPPGLTASLRKDEFADLVKFMSRLGKEGDFKVSAERLVRTFRSLDDKDGDLGYLDMIRHNPMELVTTDDTRLLWNAAYSKTNGDIPLDEFPKVRGQGRETLNFIRFDLDAKRPGNSVLQFNDPEGLHLFVGEDRVEKVSRETSIVLQPGVNQITVGAPALNRKNRTLRIEILDSPEDAAQVEVVYGK